jgi:hypothetical protein
MFARSTPPAKLSTAVTADKTTKKDVTLEGLKKDAANKNGGEKPPTNDGGNDGTQAAGAKEVDNGDPTGVIGDASKVVDKSTPNIIPTFKSETNIAMKDEKLVKKGKTEFNLNIRTVMQQSTLIGGFIGIGGESDEMKNGLVRFVTPNDWSLAKFMLPKIGPELLQSGITNISITVNLVDADGNAVKGAPKQKTVLYPPPSGPPGMIWHGTDASITEGFLTFPLAALRQRDVDPLTDEQYQSLQFDVTTTIEQKNVERLVLQSRTRIFDGASALASPTNDLVPITISSEYLFDSDPELKFAKVTVTIPSSGRSVSSFINKQNATTPLILYAKRLPPDELVKVIRDPEEDGGRYEVVLEKSPIPPYVVEVQFFNPRPGPVKKKVVDGVPLVSLLELLYGE